MLLHRAVALVVALALIGPSTAAAQSGASDNQYSDPFANTPTPGSHGAPGAHTTTPRRGSSAPAPAPAASAAPAASGAPPGSAAPPSGSPSSSGVASVAAGSRVASSGVAPQTLPFTGFSALDEAIGGAVLLLAGAGLRLRLRRQRGSRAMHRAAAR